ncbi:hypothetical protein, partial [Vibrio crassostreae]|uniref:hypothetical protein n=1 Tax=Vibrio crassostreae TaxID=246167 RepID=UPI001B3167F8
DFDGDGLTNVQEAALHTSLVEVDTDGDGINDYHEVVYNWDPLNTQVPESSDFDSDGISNIDELYTHHTNPESADSDGDGLVDALEISLSWDPLVENSGSQSAGGDFDGDGLSNLAEVNLGTDPKVTDSDGDGVSDGQEAIQGSNPLDQNSNTPQIDTDNDGLFDVHEELYDWDKDNSNSPVNGGDGDADGDGLTNKYELELGTNPTVVDSDNDGISDFFELTYHWDPVNASSPEQGGNGDADSDGLSNADEIHLHQTNPTSSDSDGDGLSDSDELTYGWSPTSEASPEQGSLGDADNDGLFNLAEIALGLNPTQVDTDADGWSDSIEVEQDWDGLDAGSPSYHPNDDADNDGLSNLVELGLQSNYLSSDSDEDGLNDGVEYRLGWDVLVANIGNKQAASDYDGDGLLNNEEQTLGTALDNADSDDDGLSDYIEALTQSQVDEDEKVHWSPLVENSGVYAELSDFDGDGLTNVQEAALHTSLVEVDTDSDGINDYHEVVYNWDPLSADSPNNGSEGDADGDGLSNIDEITIYHTNPASDDSDGDLLNDGIEVESGWDPTLANSDLEQQSSGDSDGDGLSNYEEAILGTSLTNADTDGDSYSDYTEVLQGSDPFDSHSILPVTDSDNDGLFDIFELQYWGSIASNQTGSGDADNDGLTNLQEQVLTTNPMLADSDGDGVSDIYEVTHGWDAIDGAIPTGGLLGDADGDNLTNQQELMNHETDPNRKDTDLDGYDDNVEILYLWDPLDESSPDSENSDTDSLTNIIEIAMGTSPILDDSDGDGWSDDLEVENSWDPLSSNSPNFATTDDNDGDGISNLAEISGGVTNYLLIDTDYDGVHDHLDEFPDNSNETEDTDGDGVGNNADSDDDNDGHTDTNDQFPLDANEWLDTDGDGIGNNSDADDDNDGFNDSEDSHPLDPLNGNVTTGINYTGTFPEDYTLAFADYSGSHEADDYVFAGYGVVAFDSPNHTIDMDNSLVNNATNYTMWYSHSAKKLISYHGNSGSPVDSIYAFSGIETLSQVTDDGVVTRENVLTTSSSLEKETIIKEVNGNNKKTPGGYDAAWIGSKNYLQLDANNGTLDNFLSDGGGHQWAFGFTVLEDWDAFGGAPNMFVNQSEPGNPGNMGVAFHRIGNNFYDHIAYSYSNGPTETSSGLYFAESSMPRAGDHVVFQQYGNGYVKVFVNGIEFANVSLNLTFPSQNSVSNPTLTWGKPKILTSPGDLYFGDTMPTYWHLGIRDLWVSNNGNLDSVDIAELSEKAKLAQITSSSHYSEVTHHWSLTSGLEADKGELDFTLETDRMEDADKDGFSDDIESLYLWDPLDANSPATTDEDSDGLSNTEEITLGTSPIDSDSDDDLWNDSLEVTQGWNPLSSSSPSILTTGDEDGDSLLNQVEVENGTDPYLPDSDHDGVNDNLDHFPLDHFEVIDSDGDGVGDNADYDDDNDGYADTIDSFPLDVTEWLDTDGDGIGNNSDDDDDNDSINDGSDSYPLDPLNGVALTASRYLGRFPDDYLMVFEDYRGIYEAQDFKFAGYGVAVYQAGAYVLDFDGDITVGRPEDYIMWYSPSSKILIAYRTDTAHRVSSLSSFTGIENSSEVVDGAVVYVDDYISGYSSSLSYYEIFRDIDGNTKQTVGGYDAAWLGTKEYLELQITDNSLDEFLSDGIDDQWAFGFTILEDWKTFGGGQNMFVNQSLIGKQGNLGLNFKRIGNNFYDYITYSYSNGTTNTSSGLSFTEQDMPRAGDHVVFWHYGAGKVKIYVNGEEKADVSVGLTFHTDNGISNPTITWGKPKTFDQPGDTYYGDDMATYWHLELRDLWISNNDQLDNNDILEVSNKAKIGHLSDSDSYPDITHHWSFLSDLTADKGGADFILKSD